MRTWSIALSLALLMSVGTAAQTVANSSPNPAPPVISAEAPKVPDVSTTAAPLIGGGTGVIAELSKSVNAKKAKPGDRVKAEVIQDVIYRGKVVVRMGSKLIGHVTMAKARTKEDGESQLGIIFDKAELKGGGEINLVACIRALAAPSSMSMVDKPELMAPPPLPGAGGGGGPQPLGNPRTASGPTRGGVGISSANQGVGSGASASAAYNQGQMAPNAHHRRERTLLSSASRGVYGLRGVSLAASGAGASQSTVISSMRDDVKLETGVQIVVQLNVPATQ
jgi:hypothetical protein